MILSQALAKIAKKVISVVKIIEFFVIAISMAIRKGVNDDMLCSLCEVRSRVSCLIG